MPTSAPGSRCRRGFTLIELLVVVAIIAISVALVSLALRDSSADLLERDGQRLAMLLEAARSESRASGLAVWWVPGADAEDADFRFVGLPARMALPKAWLARGVQAEVVGAPRVTLGPDALIGVQRVVLRLGQQQVVVATDGLAPFALASGVDDAP